MANTKVTIKRDEEQVAKNRKKAKRQLIMMITVIALGILVFAGTSYAVFTTVVKGDKEHTIVAGIFDITFTEGSNIVLDNTYPLSDEKGLETSPYTFTIKNTGTVDAMYRIKLEEDTSIPSEMLRRDQVKISYKKNDGSYSTPQLVSSLDQELIIETDQPLNTEQSVSYEIKMWVDENAGNDAQGKKYRTKIVVEAVQAMEGQYTDTIPPVVTLNGEATMNLTKGSAYTEAGVASVEDDQDGSLSTSNVNRTYQYYDGSNLTTVSSVNTSNVGIYYVYYKIKDSNGNEGLAVRTINVNEVDTTPPTLTLSGSTSISLYEFRTYTEPGYSASDATDGSLTDRVVVIDPPNTNKAGVYVIKYIVTDNSGNITSKTRTVTVKSAIAAEVVKSNIGSSGAINTSDSEQTFITGTNPNNYIWYSGKLWRAVSIDPSDNSVKMITQHPQTTISYNSSGNTVFADSYADQWLNNTAKDGFLGTLREYQSFIKTDSEWNATQTTSTSKPSKTTMVTRSIGLLNIYEFTKSYAGATASTGYLNNSYYWFTLTPYSSANVWQVSSSSGNVSASSPRTLRPVVNLLPSVKISSGSGTQSDPYRLHGDDIKPSNGTLLNTRYSGEYVMFNNELYRIVDSSYSNTTKIIKMTTTGTAYPFDTTSSVLFNPNSGSNIGVYLNVEWYGTLSATSQNMMTTGPWYRGTVALGEHYLLSKCTTTTCTSNATSVTARVGLPRLGELVNGYTYETESGRSYWLLTPRNSTTVDYMYPYGYFMNQTPGASNTYVRPSLYLKSTVKISGGSGTPNDPFTLTS